MGFSVKTISIIVAANVKGLEKGMGKANKSLANFASSAARMGSLLTFSVTAPLAALGKTAVDTFAEFEDSMMKVNVVTGATQEEFGLLQKEAKRLGQETRFTARQFADLQLILGRKGFDPSQIIAMEESIAKLALATGEDLSLAAETVSASLKAFNLDANESSRVANTLAQAAATSSIQLSTFATAFGHAGSSAKAVGVTVERLSAMMGVLMDNGIKASKAGTGLRKIFSKLNQEGIPFNETLEQMASGQMTLNDATALVGETASNQLLILSNNLDKVNELTNSYETNTTALGEMAAKKHCTVEDIIALHTGVSYLIYFIGFLPGFLYLGGLHATLHTPRIATPRIRVAKGSVGIGGAQTGVYPQNSSGGWNIIGKSPVNFFNTNNVAPIFAKPGDRIQFIPITLATFYEVEKEVANKTYTLKSSLL